MPMRMDVTPPARNRSLATVRTVGAVVGAALAGALLAIFVVDRRIHIGDVGNDSLLPWWLFVGWGLVFYALYWVGLRYLLRTLRRNDAANKQLIAELTAANENLELAQQLGRTGTWAATRDGMIRWTGKAAELIGLPPSQTLMPTEGFAAIIDPADRKRALASYFSALRSRQPLAVDFRLNTADGSQRWVSVRGAVSDDRSRIAGTIVDVSRQMQAHERLVTAEHQFRALFEKNPLPFCVYDAETLKLLEVNQAVVAQFGYSRDEFLQMSILDVVPPEQREAAIAQVRDSAGQPTMEPRVWTVIAKNGQAREIRVHSSAIRFQNRPAWLILAEDVTEALARQRDMAYRATHDPVTGVLNARALAERLQADDGHPWRLAYIQLRGLELIEDSLGPEVGTRVLQRMACRLELLAQAFGELGHVRTEEFVLAVRDPAQWDRALGELRQALAQPVAGRDSRQQLESWIGIADFPGDHPDATQAIRQAALAAHLARSEGRPLLAFEPAMTRKAGERLRMAARLHRALEQGEFELHFQKIQDVGEGRPVGLEALLRWPQAEGGYIAPNDFIPVAEDTGLIVPLGRWVLREAARAHQRLQAADQGHLTIAINVSGAQFLNNDLAAEVEAVLREHALPRGALHIELTESILMQRPEQAREHLQQLQARGVCISLDDFGTGFSSMAYLRQLPIDAMKIDRAFVRNVHADRRNASICQALLQLGHSLGLTVVAEGVEEQDELDWLRANRCDQAQGYCLGKPAPLEEVLPHL